MPLYEFECPCGHVTEHVFPHDCIPSVKCWCGKKSKKLISSPAFVIGDSMMEPADFDRKFGRGAAALMASDRDHRKKHDGKAADHGFKGPEWLRPK